MTSPPVSNTEFGLRIVECADMSALSKRRRVAALQNFRLARTLAPPQLQPIQTLQFNGTPRRM